MGKLDGVFDRSDVVLLAELAQGGRQGRAVQGILNPLEAFGLKGLFDFADGAAASATRQFVGAFEGRRAMVAHSS